MAQEQSYDLAIVGGGTAGCILAARIAENGIHPQTKEKLRIILLEAGPDFRGESQPGYGNPLRRKIFTNIPRDFTGSGISRSVNPRYSMRGGSKILGGSSVAFGGQSHIPFPADYANWNYTTGVDWTEENFAPAASEVRRVFNVHADKEETLSPGQLRFRTVSQSLGYDVQPYEGAKQNCIFCGFCGNAHMCKYDAKMSTLLTHVPDAEKYGVEIITDVMAERILFQGTKATGILYTQAGEQRLVEAEKIILSCGAVQTPKLLWESGFGPRDLLGSETIVENQNVGRRAHCHPENYIWALFPEPIKDGDRGWNAGTYFLHRMNKYGHDTLFFQDSGMGGGADPERFITSEFAPEFGREIKEFMNVGRRSVGRVVLWTNPKEAEGYLDDQLRLIYDTDHPMVMRRLAEALDIAEEILRKMGAIRFTPKEFLLTPPGTSPQSIRLPHLASTCRAGADPKTSVVDPRFRSHDVDNLFICDASVLPRTAIGSLCMAVATVATFAAQRLVSDHFS